MGTAPAPATRAPLLLPRQSSIPSPLCFTYSWQRLQAEFNLFINPITVGEEVLHLQRYQLSQTPNIPKFPWHSPEHCIPFVLLSMWLLCFGHHQNHLPVTTAPTPSPKHLIHSGMMLECSSISTGKRESFLLSISTTPVVFGVWQCCISLNLMGMVQSRAVS